MHAKPILVTGATGYIGGRLVPQLLAKRYRVRCLARDPRATASNFLAFFVASAVTWGLEWACPAVSFWRKPLIFHELRCGGPGRSPPRTKASSPSSGVPWGLTELLSMGATPGAFPRRCERQSGEHIDESSRNPG